MDLADPEIKKNDNQSVLKSVPEVNINTTTKVEVKYHINELIENSKALTGYGKEVAVGALFDCKEKEFTKDDFKKKVKEFLGRKVE